MTHYQEVSRSQRIFDCLRTVSKPKNEMITVEMERKLIDDAVYSLKYKGYHPIKYIAFHNLADLAITNRESLPARSIFYQNLVEVRVRFQGLPNVIEDERIREGKELCDCAFNAILLPEEDIGTYKRYSCHVSIKREKLVEYLRLCPILFEGVVEKVCGERTYWAIENPYFKPGMASDEIDSDTDEEEKFSAIPF